MAFLSPDGMDVFRRTEPSGSLLGKQASTGMDVFRRTESAVSVLVFEAPPPGGTAFFLRPMRMM